LTGNLASQADIVFKAESVRESWWERAAINNGLTVEHESIVVIRAFPYPSVHISLDFFIVSADEVVVDGVVSVASVA